ncbi:MAG: rhodanese-related sulfurtransferase [Planctomycetota bacterium]|nr:MAG: rhodanese-related sulfurtransferase [Planctomycetota bacterium]
MGKILRFLQSWYEDQCDGNWEHQHGVKIETLDNPGWAVVIDLAGTDPSKLGWREISEDRSPSDWIRCYITDDSFKGFGGPKNLEEILQVFVKLAEEVAGP